MENKTEIYQLRLTQQEANAFAAWAEKIGEPRSRLLRKFIRQAINEEPDLLLSEQITFRQAVNELVRCTRCLNQITAAIKAGQSHENVIDNQLIQSILAAVNDLKVTLNFYLKHTHLRWVKPAE